MNKFLKENGWQIKYTTSIPGQEGKYYTYNDLNLSNPSINFLNETISKGLYLHQKEAIKNILSLNNICLTTKTDSGKSLIFYLSAIEQLVKNKKSKIIAIYPLRALGQEQENYWNKAIEQSGLNFKVGRIDGQVNKSFRLKIIKDSQILILTPDIIHAWLLNNTNNNTIINFLSNIKIIIIDEIHNYTGVFGSNCAFLFRRLQHIMKLLGTSPQYITASATITDPDAHLTNLFGLDFKIIDSSFDSSPRHELTIKLVEQTKTKDLLSSVSNFLKFIATNTEHKFLAFVDSRKQTEYITSIISRQNKSITDDKNKIFDSDHLSRLNILPFRSGYELEDRLQIQNRLNKGALKGVVSTSALELGINVPFLTLGILIGVPHSITSFYQRIGRIGRISSGEIVIINTGDIFSENIFRNPEHLLNMPLSEGALYLENSRIQYIHALCLARLGGEHDNICSYINKNTNNEFESPISWPKGFLTLCKSERIGMIPIELQNMKGLAGDNPNHTFPLRDVDIQFKVQCSKKPYVKYLGSLSYSQLMREAYPGAVYYYTTKSFRVYKINALSRIVYVRYEKKYTTIPSILPILVYPDFNSDSITIKNRYNKLICAECNLQIGERISGYKEKRGPNSISVNYPLDYKHLGINFDQMMFTRYFFTSGVIIIHPSLNNANVQCNLIANILYEAFIIAVPFESRDIHFACDKFKISNEYIKKGDKFISIYDQTYGSLRLSSRFSNKDILREALEISVKLAENDSNININQETLLALKELQLSSLSNPIDIELEYKQESRKNGIEPNLVEVILPGSEGIDLVNNKEYIVEGVFYSKIYDALVYRGRHKYDIDEEKYIITPLKNIKEISGVSKYGFYNQEMGCIDEK